MPHHIKEDSLVCIRPTTTRKTGLHASDYKTEDYPYTSDYSKEDRHVHVSLQRGRLVCTRLITIRTTGLTTSEYNKEDRSVLNRLQQGRLVSASSITTRKTALYTFSYKEDRFYTRPITRRKAGVKTSDYKKKGGSLHVQL